MSPVALATLALAALVASGCGREYMLPRPEPLPEYQDRGLSAGEQRKLADVRRFVEPNEQALIERSLRDLARDPRLPQPEVTDALRRALDGSATGFCARLASELAGLRLVGAEAQAPEAVALVASIDTVHASWLSAAGRSRYPDTLSLARAIRDGAFAPGSLDTSLELGDGAGVLFVTDAAALEGSSESAAGRFCLKGPPAASYVVARIPRSKLVAPLRVPTAADGVCRRGFVLPAPDAAHGETCGGAPEYVTRPVTLGAVDGLRLSR